MHCRVLVLLVCAALAGACGGAPAAPAPTPTATRAPELARTPKAAGEIVVTGEASPASHGPYEFKGAYTVRFEQYAPEDPKLDFGTQTTFVATLDREAEITRGDSVTLFEAASAGETRRLEIDGRFFVDVSFGDFPYVIRFTPRG